MTGFMIAGVLTAIFILLGLGCIREHGLRRERDNKRGTYLSPFVLWVGVVCDVFFLTVAWLAAVDEEAGILTVLCFAAFALLGICLMLGWKNCYIIYDHKGFTQYNIIGMQRSFTYDQLTGYRFTESLGTDIKFYACGKTITVDWMSRNAIDFLFEARKGYARCNNGRELTNRWEEIRKIQKTTGKGSFSAHVHNPGEFLVCFIMLLVLLIGTLIFMCIMAFEPITQEDCQLQTLTFHKWKTDGDTLFLWAEGVDDCFEIGGYEKYLSDFEELTAKCNGKTVFTARTEHYEPDDDDPYYAIRELFADGVTYRSMEDSNEYSQEGAWLIVAVFCGILVLFLALSWLTYKIGCNPGKYPKWLVRGFFKEGSISY